MADVAAEKQAIREVVENWVLYRDARMWERFRTVWHPEGWMMATWFQGGFEEFIKASQEGFDRGVRILHEISGTTVDIAGNRAMADSKMKIMQRAPVDGVLCDVTCFGRFYNFLEKRDGRWGIVLRETIYEKDRLDPVDPAAVLKLDKDLLARFPEGYRHLAYLQTRVGFKVKTDMPGHEGPVLEALYARGKRWLEGKPLEKAA
jgi:SnoaL-like protein